MRPLRWQARRWEAASVWRGTRETRRAGETALRALQGATRKLRAQRSVLELRQLCDLCGGKHSGGKLHLSGGVHRGRVGRGELRAILGVAPRNEHPPVGRARQGLGQPEWTGTGNVGTAGVNDLTADFVDAAVWALQTKSIAIMRHQNGVCEAVKVWRFKQDTSMAQRFDLSDASTLRSNVTAGGHIYSEVEADLNGLAVDPIFGVGGDLMFNWKYYNNGARIVMSEAYLSCETCNDDDTHGFGNDFALSGDGSGSGYAHDASILQADCHGGTCTQQGSDVGTSLDAGPLYGQYAIYVSEGELTTFACLA
eukprot:CAMPEP_0180297706 /NCGR_PEP_ID=MMETSP0988-20121125/20700_1 /TAXON_ID=697907 /ORGANISM="non described non described, Strain CCMP2293" /LENGTH=309 /DNA_ID=CAMNT_0022276419 /DNA_START=82 /DNA_END=1012 /DNA_ORIENTATION=-